MKNNKELKKIALKLGKKILSTIDTDAYSKLPFQHCIVDNAFDPEILKGCDFSFEDRNNSQWDHQDDSDIEIKSRSNWESEMDIPEGVLPVVRIFNSAIVLRAISEVFGIKKLIPDPYFTGGGMNVTQPGGLLDVHVDGNYHDATGLNRRINILLYLTQGWKENWGGELGLYSDDGETCVKKIPPIRNRVVIFDTHDKSYHGLPSPLNYPSGKERRSIILYYYTLESRPSDQIVEKNPHSALWKKRGFLDKRGNRVRSFE